MAAAHPTQKHERLRHGVHSTIEYCCCYSFKHLEQWMVNAAAIAFDEHQSARCRHSCRESSWGISLCSAKEGEDWRAC